MSHPWLGLAHGIEKRGADPGGGEFFGMAQEETQGEESAHGVSGDDEGAGELFEGVFKKLLKKNQSGDGASFAG